MLPLGWWQRGHAFVSALHHLHLSCEDLGGSGFIHYKAYSQAPLGDTDPLRGRKPSGRACPTLRLSRLLLMLLFISEKKNMTTFSGPHGSVPRPSFPASHKHFTDFMAENEPCVSVDSLSLCLGEELTIAAEICVLHIARHSSRTREPSAMSELQLSPAQADRTSF